MLTFCRIFYGSFAIFFLLNYWRSNFFNWFTTLVYRLYWSIRLNVDWADFSWLFNILIDFIENLVNNFILLSEEICLLVVIYNYIFAAFFSCLWFNLIITEYHTLIESHPVVSTKLFSSILLNLWLYHHLELISLANVINKLIIFAFERNKVLLFESRK